MCKIFALPGIKKENLAKVQRLVKEATDVMKVGVDDDGVGYAAITKDGQIFGEKWLNPADAFRIHQNPEPPEPSLADVFLDNNFGGAIKDIKVQQPAEDVYDRFGAEITSKNREETVAIILHTRNKTSGEKVLEDTHPFCLLNDEHTADHALIHNGTIKNHEEFKKLVSNCDSEVILRQYLDLNMAYEPENMTKLAKSLAGEYAVALLTSIYDEKSQGPVPILDIFKSNKELVCGYIYELDSPVFATTKYVLTEACRKAELTLSDVYDLKDGKFIRMYADTGEAMLDFIDFDLSPQNRTYHSNQNWPGHQQHHRPPPPPTTINSDTINLDLVRGESNDSTVDMKAAFEQDNADIFDTDYYEVAPLTEKEKELLVAIEKDPHVNSRALALVQRACGLRA